MIKENGVTDFGYRVTTFEDMIVTNHHFHGVDTGTNLVHLITRSYYAGNTDGSCDKEKLGEMVSWGKHCYENISQRVIVTNHECTCKQCKELVAAGKRLENL